MVEKNAECGETSMHELINSKLGTYVLAGFIFSVFVGSYIISGGCKQAEVTQQVSRKKIALLVMATGKYINFVPPLLKTARQHFCPNHDVTFCVFTDGQLKEVPDVLRFEQAQMGWPYDSMMRFHTYYKYKDQLQDFDYLYACDADMLFADTVGNEILSDRVAVRHLHFFFERGMYETNPLSTACINRCEGNYYYAGAFYGGKKDTFFNMLHDLKTNVDIDMARGILPVFNDESHLNRYLINHEPTKILSPSYCHFEHISSPYKKKIVALIKHDPTNVKQLDSISPTEYFVATLSGKFNASSEIENRVVV